MKVNSTDFNEIRTQAKGLGINTKGMNKEAIIVAIEAVPNTETRGRKVNPESARQKRLANQTPGQRGRKPDPNSAWNIRQKELAEKREAGTLQLGRPVDPNSARQERLAKQGTVKRGRPVGTGKKEEVVNVIPTTEQVAEAVADKLVGTETAKA